MNILFVCSGNTCRSPMAQALFKEIIRKRPGLSRLGVKLDSAGTAVKPGFPASPLARETMEKRGLSLDGHITKRVSKDLLASQDLVLTMMTDHKQRILSDYPSLEVPVKTLPEYVGESEEIEDPMISNTPKAYEACANQIERYLEKLADKLETNKKKQR